MFQTWVNFEGDGRVTCLAEGVRQAFGALQGEVLVTHADEVRQFLPGLSLASTATTTQGSHSAELFRFAGSPSCRVGSTHGMAHGDYPAFVDGVPG